MRPSLNTLCCGSRRRCEVLHGGPTRLHLTPIKSFTDGDSTGGQGSTECRRATWIRFQPEGGHGVQGSGWKPDLVMWKHCEQASTCGVRGFQPTRGRGLSISYDSLNSQEVVNRFIRAHWFLPETYSTHAYDIYL